MSHWWINAISDTLFPISRPPGTHSPGLPVILKSLRLQIEVQPNE